MIVISTNFVLTGIEAELSLDHPVIGWRNLVSAGNIVADSEDANFPVSNLANPATFLEWRSVTSLLQYLTITTGEIDPIDYIGIAGHNFSSAAIAVSIEGFIGAVWTELVAPIILPDDGPALFRFTAQSLSDIRIKLAAGSAPPRAAVVYCQKLLVVERRIYKAYLPLPHGRKAAVVNGRSESGNFLGRIVTGEFRQSTAAFSLLRPDWYRDNMDAFLQASKETPFFFAWRPQTYPLEVGYAWMQNDPEPRNDDTSGRIAIELEMQGVA